ncbi:HEAT repeat domain-containing protein [Actinoplanes awajinensis]|uniref:PBS lyase n=1 Tax=Actinoplanes awajinensis subsp. mycoplanecinus TaxID=135947 RepID=A0A101JEH4_9ACTN|nr:HEAT repeat domain-containing protein [Actinoplanes awajinensis]KUL25217.1 hypothetical protein ADL15_41245 [Actinoplanes awajinensis subsp. mycoplanecinus]
MSALESVPNATLIGHLDHPDPTFVAEVIQELARRNAMEAAPRVLELLRTTQEAVIRHDAALALSDMKIPEAFDAIVELLRDPRTQGRRGTLLYALDPYDCAPILELLVDLALTGGYEVRMSALGLLSGIETDIDEPTWERLSDRLKAAAATADEQRRSEVIDPLNALFH